MSMDEEGTPGPVQMQRGSTLKEEAVTTAREK